MAGNPGTLGLGAVVDTPAMVSHMKFTSVSDRVGWNFCSVSVGTAGVGAGGNIILACCFPVVPAWKACFVSLLRVADFLAHFWGSHHSLSSWTCKSATEENIALVLSRIW